MGTDTIEDRSLELHATMRDRADGLLAGSDDGGRLSYADRLALARGSGASIRVAAGSDRR